MTTGKLSGLLYKGIPTEETVVLRGTGNDETRTVGHAPIAAIAYTDVDISDNLADAETDGGTLAAPGAWTNLVNLTGKYSLVFVAASTIEDFLSAQVDTNESAGDGVRVQVTVDGTIIADFTVEDSSSNPGVYWLPRLSDGTRSVEYPCKTSFNIRATRLGTFSDVGSHFKMAKVIYSKVS